MTRLESTTASNPLPQAPRPVASGAEPPKPAETARLAGDRSGLEDYPHARDAQGFARFLLNQNEQGITNGCGTTSLAMLLNFWKGKPEEYSRGRIDLSIRHFDMPTSPQNIAGYAQRQGFRTSVQNNASVEDLTGFLKQGVPAMVLFDPDGVDSDSTLHYVVATDYQTDDKGNVTHIRVADPWGGQMEDIPVEEFKQRWDKLAMGDHSTGVSNLFIPMLPKENVPIRGKDGKVRLADDIKLPEKDGLGWRMGVADKAFDVANLASKVVNAVKNGAKKLWNGLKSLF